MIIKPKITLINPLSAFFRRKAPGMFPRITRVVKAAHIFQLMDFRFFQAIIKFVGYPITRDTGEIFTLSVVKLKIVVKTRPFVNPHNPFTKNAAHVCFCHFHLFFDSSYLDYQFSLYKSMDNSPLSTFNSAFSQIKFIATNIKHYPSKHI